MRAHGWSEKLAAINLQHGILGLPPCPPDCDEHDECHRRGVERDEEERARRRAERDGDDDGHVEDNRPNLRVDGVWRF